ncbi:hypothetical protein V8E36_002683, partial [Tilletia maclaganii]
AWPHSRCHCGRPAAEDAQTLRRSCRLFHSLGIWNTEIEVQQCNCRSGGERRTIGPDLAEYGLFNWNNEIVLTHELLNAYSSQFYTSPTPLAAFCATVQHTYDEHAPSTGPPSRFLARATFIKVFFAFIQVQAMSTSFCCPTCGSTPVKVIADGVVLAHSARLRHEALCPPTMPSSHVEKRPSSTPILPFLPTKPLRNQLRRCVEVLTSSSTAQSEALDDIQKTFDEHIASKSTVSIAARTWFSSLLALLRDAFAYIALQIHLLEPYSIAFTQLAADEGLFQLCRPVCVPTLLALADSSAPASLERFTSLANTLSKNCPALGGLAQCHLHQAMSGSTSLDLFDLPPSLRPFFAATAAYIGHQEAS